MTSAGERVEQHVQLLRLLMERDGVSVDDALSAAGALIPAGEQAAALHAYHAQTSTTIEVLAPNEITARGGPRSWYGGWDSSGGYYWRRQRRFLAQGLHRNDYEIDSLDLSSDHVLSHLEDPRSPDPFDVRGLVVGHVQSGKTANFSALIAKAADAGYRVIIVLSGLHNTLRQQTQRRLQRDLGHEDTSGVGLPEPGRRWVYMTNAEPWGDFNPHAINASLLQGNDHVILVVKKNKSRMERLINWMAGRVPPHVPVLVIDDEADQASVNTRGNRSPREEVDLAADDFDGDEPSDDELDPSAINLRVRRLLRLFARCSYVAYTATPFANVLINPEAFDAEGGRDLFPKDFILNLPAPPGGKYVGAERLFGRGRLPGETEAPDDGGLDVIEVVPDHDADLLVPPPRQSAGFVPSMPESLRQALIDYVLASAGWLHRAGRDVPCTMLVHTDMRKAMQNPLASEITKELAYIRQRWRYEREACRPQLQRRWDEHFRPVCTGVSLDLDAEFASLEPFIDQLMRDGIPVRVLNSDWPDTADFDEEPTLKAVLVGGNKLSRGVTIEGLLVSYYVRETLYYDTLMQMGRWFGYRGDYVDLTRLYSTQLLVSCFHDLATAEEELRRQFTLYETRRLTPADFVPKVRTHPMMLVTQQNKMRDAVELSLSYAGKLAQTLRFRVDETQVATRNLERTRAFLGSLGDPRMIDGQPTWADVDVQRVVRFFSEFELLEQLSIDPRSLIDYIDEQVRQQELIRWRVLLACGRQPSPELSEGAFDDLGVADVPQVPLIGRTRLKNDPTSLGVITNPDDELHGLCEDQLRRAEDNYVDGPFRTRGEAIRATRPAEEGLLIVYPISAYSQPRRNASARIPLYSEPRGKPILVGFAVSFPGSESPATVTYVAAGSHAAFAR